MIKHEDNGNIDTTKTICFSKIGTFLLLISLSLFISILHAGSMAVLDIQNGDASPIELINNCPLSRLERVHVAKELLNNLKNLRNLIPKVSQISEKNLMEQSQAIHSFPYTKDNNRKEVIDEFMRNTNSYYNNPDHYSFEVYEEINSISEDLNLVIKSTNLKDEMYHWTNIALGLMDINIWQPDIEGLVHNGSIEKSFAGPEWPLYKIYHGFGIEIIMNIVQPYLSNTPVGGH